MVDQLSALSRFFHVVALVPVVVRRANVRPLIARRHPRTMPGGFTVHLLPLLPASVVGRYVGRRVRATMTLRGSTMESDARFRGHLKSSIAGAIRRQAAVLHARHHFRLVHGHEPMVGDEAAPIGRALDIPSVVTLHATYEFHQSAFGPQVMRAVLANVAAATRVFSVSAVVRRSYRSRIDRDIAVVGNGFRYRPPGPRPALLRPVPPADPLILYAGFLIPEKRVDLLLAAVARLPMAVRNRARVVIAGVGPQEANLRLRAASQGAEDRILFAGAVPPEEMGGYYAAADVIVQPSINEGFSMTCLEAMGYGRPFICTRNAGVTEFFEDGVEGFAVAPDDVGALAGRLEHLLTDPALAAAMGAAGRERAKAYEWDHKVHEFVDRYNELILAGNRA